MRRRTAAALAGLLVAGLFGVGGGSTASAVDESKGYEGRCVGDDAQSGTTVVVDFQQLDGNGGTAAPTIVRCAPSGGVSRTGVQTLKDAGIALAGNARYGEAFICRIEDRPSSAETIPIIGRPDYQERCIDTSPAAAYWSYWHADGQGEDWQYSSFGATNRSSIPGGFEGWSFALNATATTNPPPRLEGDPVNDQLDPTAPGVTVSSSALTPTIEVGTKFTLSWTSSNAVSLVAGGAWTGDVAPIAAGSRVITPTQPGSATYELTATSADGRTAKAAYTIQVTGGGGDPGPDPDPETPVTSSLAEATAAWLIRELDPAGEMPAPLPTADQPTDWGLTIDTLWALHAAGTGRTAERQIVAKVDRNAGDYMGVKLFKDTKVRRGGQTAKLLVAAVVAGQDPTSFGRVMRADGTVTSKRYDMRAETLRLVSPTTGRISDTGIGIDNTNVFSQSLAVMGLARSGGVERLPVTYLLRQQCSDGYFRMFDRHGKTCDHDGDAADGDGTAMGIQALMTAREAGVTGLDDDIDAGVEWLLEVQRKDGSFGGGVTTGGSNSNSTGLIAQTLAAAGEKKAYRRAAAYVASLQVTAKNGRGTGLAGEVGAIAYDAEAFGNGRRDGIRGRDQWRRATAQAIFASAPVSFVDLGKKRLADDPDALAPLAPGAPAAPPSGPAGTPVVPASGTAPVDAGSPDASGRLGRYLAGQLVGGDHVEVEVGGLTYVDYDLTADVVLALRQLGEQGRAADRAARFLLDERSVRAYADGAPYESDGAGYAEPLAKLELVALSSRGKKAARAARTLGGRLAGLEQEDGTFDDVGTYADTTASTVRHAWATLATTAGDRGDTAAIGALASSVCADGALPETLGAECDTGDVSSTAIGVQALNATRADDTGIVHLASVIAPDDWSDERVDTLTSATRRLQDVPAADRPADVSSVAAGQQAAGLDTRTTSAWLAGQQRQDGGISEQVGGRRSDLVASIRSAAGLSARSWLSTPGLPLAPGMQAPVLAESGLVTSAVADQQIPRWAWVAGGALVVALMAAAFCAGLLVTRAPRRSQNQPQEAAP